MEEEKWIFHSETGELCAREGNREWTLGHLEGADLANSGRHDKWAETYIVNGALIAAAPDLLEACMAFLQVGDGGKGDSLNLKKLFAAFELAQGAVEKALAVSGGRVKTFWLNSARVPYPEVFYGYKWQHVEVGEVVHLWPYLEGYAIVAAITEGKINLVSISGETAESLNTQDR